MYCLLYVTCCLLFVEYRLLFGVCCLLFVVSFVFCLLTVAWPFIAACLLCVDYVPFFCFFLGGEALCAVCCVSLFVVDR